MITYFCLLVSSLQTAIFLKKFPVGREKKTKVPVGENIRVDFAIFLSSFSYSNSGLTNSSNIGWERLMRGDRSITTTISQSFPLGPSISSPWNHFEEYRYVRIFVRDEQTRNNTTVCSFALRIQMLVKNCPARMPEELQLIELSLNNEARNKSKKYKKLDAPESSASVESKGSKRWRVVCFPL